MIENDQITKIQLYIRSQPLLNALRSVVTYSSDEHSGEDLEEGLFDYPYQLLYHYKDELEVYGNCGNCNHTPERNRETKEHIAHLISFLYSQTSVNLAEVEKNWNDPVPVVNFKDLWLLYKPGQDMYVKEDGGMNAYVLDTVGGPVPTASGEMDSTNNCFLDLWNIDFDGDTLGRSAKSARVGFFEGPREITSLSLYPRKFHKKPDDMAQTLIDRGKRFFELSKGPCLQEYSGHGKFHGLKRYRRQRVMTDHSSRPWEFEELDDQDCMPPDGPNLRLADFHVPFSEYDDIKPRECKELTPHQYLLCSPLFYAFMLKDRIWDLVHVSGLREPNFNRTAIESLVMPQKTKEIIRAICKTYLQRMSGKQFFTADFIQGKGEGQIFLLHGPPGTGKTLTAECVAEYTGRPLLSITAGDLGHEPGELERKLLKYFRNGNDWDAVILLDEADVFLHDRGEDDLKRNSIVSIFLRALDYFEGILFLTTNRVGVIDEAFSSRIHMQLGFDELNDDARNKIWAMNFKRLEQAEAKVEYHWRAESYVQESEDVKDLQLNGREIRNAFQTAVALAMDDDPQKLTDKHLKDVVKMSKDFRDYMKKTRKMDPRKRAYMLGHRYDAPRTD
ncbi:P-loop containing nucleoside triphosphate hydrolase protein [Rhizodiscina lignyota]|uniref:P-loop containing nucleoside triphosphate hydrolase protein n=1 Tax=Rhizodiscina lignyota TaxID=1504668 RepID=A0A9P4M8P2_9PEZI|nr:P-loop containing nucleoside triphosphate hydrolase protein [Rhizodiscina lignyota]